MTIKQLKSLILAGVFSASVMAGVSYAKESAAKAKTPKPLSDRIWWG